MTHISREGVASDYQIEMGRERGRHVKKKKEERNRVIDHGNRVFTLGAKTAPSGVCTDVVRGKSISSLSSFLSLSLFPSFDKLQIVFLVNSTAAT